MITTTLRKTEFPGDNTAAARVTTFPIWEADDLVVIHIDSAGVELPMALTTDYTVTLPAVLPGIATITPVAIIATGDSWVAYRQTDRTQEIDYNAVDKFPASQHEEALDRGVALSQELDDERVRSLRIAVEDDDADMVLPRLATRLNGGAGGYLFFDATFGLPTVVTPFDPGVLAVTPYIETLLDDIDDATARGTLDAQEDVVATEGDIVIGDAAGDAVALAVGAADEVPISDGDTLVYGEIPYPPYYMSGIYQERAPLATAYEISFGIGTARCHTDTDVPSVLNTKNGLASAERTKLAVLDGGTGNWVEGNGANGIVNGATVAADQWLYQFLVVKSADGSFDYAFDSSAIFANGIADAEILAQGYDRYRLIGVLQLNGTPDNVRPFTFNPDSALWLFHEPQDIGASAIGAAETLSLDLPDGDLDALVHMVASDATDTGIVVRHPDATQAPVSTTDIDNDWRVGSASSYGASWKIVRTNASKQIDSDLNPAGGMSVYALSLRGFYFPRSHR